MTAKNGEAAETADREIVSTRVFNFSRELVFKAWTDPDHLVHWWGPKGFTNTFHEFDLRPGGVWRFVMHGPNGTDYQNKSVFVEIVKPERIVFDLRRTSRQDQGNLPHALRDRRRMRPG